LEKSMSAKWPKVKLGEVLRIGDTSVPVAQLPEVSLAGVYSFGRGLFKRGPIEPGKTSYRSYNRLIPDDFVISQPKAWEGALARVTPEFEGWYLSPVFPTFRADRERLEPVFLEWFCKRPSIWSELQKKSRGIGARRESVSPGQFLSLEIPLPPLSEQQRIVTRIEELAGQISKARSLASEIEYHCHALLNTAFDGIIKNVRWLPMSEAAPLVRRPVEVQHGGDYP
jgi:type I restriction enzyme S subunit